MVAARSSTLLSEELEKFKKRRKLENNRIINEAPALNTNFEKTSTSYKKTNEFMCKWSKITP